MCRPCPVDAITQGSIFNYAFSEDLDNKNVLGMLISARCDLANLKTSKYSYVPVVSLEDYIFHYLARKLFLDQKKEEVGKIKNMVKDLGHDPGIIDVYGIKKCIDKIVEKQKAKEKANEAFEKIESLNELINKNSDRYTKDDLAIIPSKKFKSEFSDLSQNKAEGYYLIDDVVDHNNREASLGPHVVLLREVHHMSAEIAEFIKKGCVHDELLEAGNSAPSLVLGKGRMSYVLCNMASPYIELVMQRFSNIFSRVGVKDPHKNLGERFFMDYIIG
ncbi:MAG: hypothetical protein CL539_03665 [Alcanivorax sp.]|jgi:hypothetical protein|nr:hypothetical protein [Alcanivorax sp.]MBG33703.1 hypothetical protein [Alcanivorax sp.]|tara:strand:+ start:103 stop:927 length:825 start_codon:yes stop_codon:yes gene_type:complete